MKHFTLLLFTIFSLSATFAQTEDREKSIDGLADFRFGMNRKEVCKLLRKHNTENTIIFDQVENVLQVTNLKFGGYIFSACSFSFRDERLSFITFGNYSDSKEDVDKAFDELVGIFENLYGGWSYKTIGRDDVEMESFSWKDKKINTLVIGKYYIQKQNTSLINIGVSKSAVN